MLKIGEFSKIGQVSVKTLHYYDQMGLLRPAHIDRYNGYRYYNLEQLVRLNRILALKDLDFSLDQIAELLKLELSSEVLKNMLHNKSEELRERLRNEHARLLRVQSRLKSIQDHEFQNHSPVVLKSAPDQQVATIRCILPKVSQLHDWQKVSLNEIKRFLDHLHEKSVGPVILIYHQDEFRETDLDVEVGIILSDNGKTNTPNEGTDDIRLYILPGVSHLVTGVTTENDHLYETYAHLTKWTQINGFRPIGPWRELTHQPEEPTFSRVIEVQRPVMEAIKFYQPLEVNKMEPKIITKPGFTVVGLRYFGKNESNEIPELWTKFNQRMKQLGRLKNETGEAAIGLCITPDEEPLEGAFEYVAGLPVTEVEDVPQDFVVRHVPDHKYAVFAHKGDMAGLKKTYEYIYETWLPQSNYELAQKMDFEYYNEDFKDFAPDSVFYIYIPIK
ncbi:MAG: GyrI-like domain-containing protein [Brevefilum sp.]